MEEIKRDHHEFGNSRLGRISQCPASLQESKDLPDAPSEDAREGTKIHKALELDDETILEKGSSARWAFWECKTFVEEKLQELGAGGEMVITHVLPEARFEYRIDGEVFNYGWLDYVALLSRSSTPEFALNIDWTFGRSGMIRSPDKDLQLEMQAMQLLQGYETLQVAINYCFNPFSQAPPLEIWVNRKDLQELEQKMMAIRNAALADQPVYSPGPACHYCPARGQCKAAQEFALAVPLTSRIPGIHTQNGELRITDEEKVVTLYEECKEKQKILAEIESICKRALIPYVEAGKSEFLSTRGASDAKITDYDKALDVIQREWPEVHKQLGQRLRHKFSVNDLQAAYKDTVTSASAAKAKRVVRETLEREGLLQYRPRMPTLTRKKGRKS